MRPILLIMWSAFQSFILRHNNNNNNNNNDDDDVDDDNNNLGVDESDGIQHSKMKEKIRKEYNRRLRLILRTELNGRNKIEAQDQAINTRNYQKVTCGP